MKSIGIDANVVVLQAGADTLATARKSARTKLFSKIIKFTPVMMICKGCLTTHDFARSSG